MKTKVLGSGTYPDVTLHGGMVWCVWHSGNSIEIVSLDPDTLAERSYAAWVVGVPSIYPKLHSWDGRLWLAYREGLAPYRIVLREIGSGHEETLTVGHGEQPVAFGAGDIAWQSTGAPSWAVQRRAIDATSAPGSYARMGVGTGLSRVLPDYVTTIDEDRMALAGYTRPSWAGDLVVAEGPQGGAYARLHDRELTLWPGQIANTPRCAMEGDRLVVVAWGGPQHVRIGVFAYGEMSAIGEGSIAPLDRPAFVGGFYVTTDKYPEAIVDYPQNIEVIVEASAISRARVPVIASPDALSGVTDPSRIIGLYVAAEEEGTASALDIAAESARIIWRQHFPAHPAPAVVGYVTRGMAARGTWPPRSIDVFAPECYFDAMPSAAGVEALVAGWAHVLTATRPWLLVIQEYDRNGAQSHLMDALAATLPAYLEAMRSRPWVLGLLAFAVNRPGGVRDYPQLLAAHQRIFAAVPGPPASLPVVVEPPQPPPEEETVHKPGINVVKFDPVLSESGTWELHVKDRNKSGIEFKVKFVNGDLKVEWTNDGWGPLSDFTGSRRHVDIKD
jgi:hypothetical protein